MAYKRFTEDDVTATGTVASDFINARFVEFGAAVTSGTAGGVFDLQTNIGGQWVNVVVPNPATDPTSTDSHNRHVAVAAGEFSSFEGAAARNYRLSGTKTGAGTIRLYLSGMDRNDLK